MDDKKLWSTMVTGEENDWIMTCGSGGSKEGANQLQRSGLVGSHAYSLLSVHEVRSMGREIKLVKLRNPWGEKEWKGAWSDDSHNWTQELR